MQAITDKIFAPFTPLFSFERVLHYFIWAFGLSTTTTFSSLFDALNTPLANLLTSAKDQLFNLALWQHLLIAALVFAIIPIFLARALRWLSLFFAKRYAGEVLSNHEDLYGESAPPIDDETKGELYFRRARALARIRRIYGIGELILGVFLVASMQLYRLDLSLPWFYLPLALALFSLLAASWWVALLYAKDAYPFNLVRNKYPVATAQANSEYSDAP